MVVSDFIRSITNEIFGSITLGMELEYNHNQRFEIPDIIYNRYIFGYYYENDMIKELKVKKSYLKNIRNIIRKYTLLSYFLTKGYFNYDRGMYDIYSGSNHLHIYLNYFENYKHDIDNNTIAKFLVGIQYLFSSFFSRTSQTFRINSSDRFLFMKHYELDYDSKRYSITMKDNKCQLEFRINENFLPFYSYILTPILVIGYMYSHPDMKEKLTEYEKGLIEDIIKFGELINGEILNTTNRKLHILLVRKLRNRRYKYHRIFNELMSRVFHYVKEFYKYIDCITSKKILQFLINYYENSRLYYVNLPKSQLFNWRENAEFYDKIRYTNNTLFYNNPNSKLLELYIRFLTRYDKTTNEILKEIFSDNYEAEKEKLLNFSVLNPV
jgi:hypothetical protein